MVLCRIKAAKREFKQAEDRKPTLAAYILGCEGGGLFGGTNPL